MQENLEFLSKGGPVLILIGLLSVIALAIAAERMLYLQRRRIAPKRFLEVLRAHLAARRLKEARELCERSDSSAAKIAELGLRDLELSPGIAAELMAERGRRELLAMERGTGALGLIASVSPLLGLLGTITGMITTFQALDISLSTSGQISPGVLANGIWEALITTAAGLSVAIPAYMANRFLISRVDSYTLELEELSSAIVRALMRHEAETNPDDGATRSGSEAS